MNRKWTRWIALAGAAAPSLACANLLIDDGNHNVIDTAVAQTVTMTNGSSIHVASGGSITGDASGSPSFYSGALGTTPTQMGDIRLSGNAQVAGGADRYGISRTIGGKLRLEDDSTVGAGTSGYALYGFNVISPPADQTMKTMLSGHALVNGHVETDGFVSLTGGAHIAGRLEEANSGIVLFMDGGTIDGRVRTGSLVGHSALISGGALLGGYGGGVADTIDFSMRGGTIDNGWRVASDDMHVEVHGGHITGGMVFGSIADPLTSASQVALFGGSIDAALGSYLLDFTSAFDHGGAMSFDCSGNAVQFDIWGGQLGYASAGNGIHLDYCATLDVYGTNLNYAGGWLTGVLADGSLLNLAVSEESRWSGELRLHDVSVPEPGTLGMFGAALGLVAFMRRRRPQPTG